MSYNCQQLQGFIERTLGEVEPKWMTEAAVRLLLGTAAVESDFGTFLRQKGGGPALGAFQIEPATFIDLKTRFADRYMLTHRTFEECEGNLWLSIVMARLKYWSIPKPLPPKDDLPGMAMYWADYYNTHGDPYPFMSKYREFIM
jgi:hypothetical protein